jgi:Kef-type K+ transport system membrane component KefB
MGSEITLIICISLIIFASPLISQRIKVPTVSIEIVLGAVCAYFTLIQENTIFELVAELGFLYLMFLAGLEVDLKKLVNVSSTILRRSLAYVAILYILSLIGTLYWGLGKIFIVILPLISIGMLAALKKEYGDQTWLNLGITVGLIGEIVSIVALTAVSAGLEYGFGWEFVKISVLFTVFMILLLVVFKALHNLIWWYPEIKTILMPKNDNQEQDIRLSMAIFFLMIAAMIYLKLEVAFGAFIAGTFIVTFFEHNKALPTKLEHFGFGWLVPLFFIYVGSSFELESLFEDGLFITALTIAATMIGIRVVAAFVFIKQVGSINVVMLALSHSMPLTLLIAVATLAYNNYSITQFYYYAFILAAILEVIAVMVIIRLLQTRFFKSNSY